MSMPAASTLQTSAVSLEQLPGELQLGIYQLRFRALQGGQLPAATGSAWRGALGRNLRKLVCSTPDLACDNCLLRKRCAYSLCFEPGKNQAQDGQFTRQAAPPPFALYQRDDIPEVNRAGTVALELSLIGNQPLLPALVRALQQPVLNAQVGQKIPLELERVDLLHSSTGEQWHPVWSNDTWYSAPAFTGMQPPDWLWEAKHVGLRFLSPVRIRHRGRMIDSELTGELFIINLIRRVSMLSEHWLSAPLGVEGKQVQAWAAATTHQSADMKLWRGSRYSHAQRRRMPINGLLGKILLDTTAIAQLLPILWLGQWLHIGKGCSFGQGRYELFNTAESKRSANTAPQTMGQAQC